MSRPRLLFNGDMVYPKKGDAPPSVPDGFWADEGNPWLMHRIFKECEHRSFKQIPTPCGATKFAYWCALDDFTTTFKHCEECDKDGQ